MSDWDTVTIIRGKNAIRGAGAAKSNAAVNAARRRGEAIATEEKYGGGGNKQHGTQLNTMKLDQETEELKHNTVSMDVGKLIQKGRQAKNLTQKDLATKINEKPQVVIEFESSKALPNAAILAKMERILDIKLRGKDKGKPLVPKDKDKAKPAVAKGKGK
ncbi:hypothetical protein TCAL_00989 [Tigriopus californicus]|uniref:HTH cro/C1-type domain-containing protein n=1 Tax=Tigriopus californicus TaxID=6832 RepID=A0A553P460_TIGCA|nr:endothelial differentiation-related factor 1-like [Tigriopus californicus]TRY72474.1 hypothetical protein TCAL_00989 [Tigriopus californicus]|eukprot:TCALIF_00989-PA protein Name:"Similar to edf1 Endothelial differentiation-related factor 1 homolog (Xenopus laevis)" AED:0.23 eAED:0.23 QI:263/1/1/1/0.5/1/3/337/159